MIETRPLLSHFCLIDITNPFIAGGFFGLPQRLGDMVPLHACRSCFSKMSVSIHCHFQHFDWVYGYYQRTASYVVVGKYYDMRVKSWFQDFQGADLTWSAYGKSHTLET